MIQNKSIDYFREKPSLPVDSKKKKIVSSRLSITHDFSINTFIFQISWDLPRDDPRKKENKKNPPLKIILQIPISDLSWKRKMKERKAKQSKAK